MSEVPPEQLTFPTVDQQVKDAAVAAGTEVASAVPAILAGIETAQPDKWSKKNLRKVALSALKNFVLVASALAVAKAHGLAGHHLTLTELESVAFSVATAAGAASLKVIELYLEGE